MTQFVFWDSVKKEGAFAPLFFIPCRVIMCHISLTMYPIWYIYGTLHKATGDIHCPPSGWVTFNPICRYNNENLHYQYTEISETLPLFFGIKLKKQTAMKKHLPVIVFLLTLTGAACLALNLFFPYLLTIAVGFLIFIRYGQLFSKK